MSGGIARGALHKFDSFAIAFGANEVYAKFKGDDGATLTRSMSWRDYSGHGRDDIRALQNAAEANLAIHVDPFIARGWGLAANG